jgi:DNA-binding SARP family transcriptional activator/ATP/maltotriose-dependent transcriptional regulator MalT
VRRLPPHHVPRPRLTDRCADFPVVVVEAAAGYGKTVLGAELLERWRSVGIDVQFDPGGVSAELMTARLRAAVRRAGFSEAAAVSEGEVDAYSVVDSLVAALANERCTFVLDDIHWANTDAAALIDHLAARIASEQRLVVLARNLPKGANRLRRAECLHLGVGDLALSVTETLAVCQQGFGLDVELEAALALDRATGGWTAATVLAVARAARTGEPLASVAAAATTAAQPAGAVAAIMDEAIVTLGPSALHALAELARLPLIDAELVFRCTSRPGLFEEAIVAGIPFAPARGPWSDLPGPVRDYLASLAPSNSDVLRTAAHEYEQRGELGVAMQLLLSTDEAAEAAALLAATSPEVVETIDVLELQAVFAQLPDDVVDAHPNVLLLVARALNVSTQFDQGRDVLERAGRLARASDDRVLERAVDIEVATGLQRELRHEEAAVIARRILDETSAGELLTRARAHHVLGQALCWRLDERGERDERALAEAQDHLARASDLYRSLNMRSTLSSLAPYWAINIEFVRGRAHDAMSRLDEALILVADRPRRRGYIMCFRAWVAADLGQDDVCRTSAEELLRLAEQLRSELFYAHAHWKLAILDSYRGQPDATLHHLRQVELHRGTWWGPASGDFLAEAADLTDRVGHTALAREYLDRAMAEPKDAEHLVALSHAVLEARHGDPVAAEALLLSATQGRIDPRERWRVTLLRGFAAYRRGEHPLAGALAAQAFEQAARLGQDDVPLVRERAITEQLLGLAIDTGSPAALALQPSAQPMALALLGRFELTLAGRPVPLYPGQETQLLKLIAVNGGRMHHEQAIESLWPEVAPDVGRHRLRTVLNRLRVVAGPILTRDGEVLVLDSTITVDLDELLIDAGRARSIAVTDGALAASVARSVIVRYRGELLPDDRYEEWAEMPRRRARNEVLDMHDLCAADATRRGDLDAVWRTLERTIEIAPHDDSRYVRATLNLLEQGRRGEALALVQRAHKTYSDIGLSPPSSLLDLEESIFV